MEAKIRDDRLDRRINKYCLVPPLSSMKEKESRVGAWVEVLQSGFIQRSPGGPPVRRHVGRDVRGTGESHAGVGEDSLGKGNEWPVK